MKPGTLEADGGKTDRSMRRRSTYAGIVIFLLITLLLWSMSILGVLRLPENLVYDAFVQLAPERERATDRVFLLESGLETWNRGDGLWGPLLELLHRNGAAQIVFMRPPPNASEAFFREAGRMGNVWFGRAVVPPDPPVRESRLEPLPNAAKGTAARFAPLVLPSPEHGVHREHAARIRLRGEVRDTLMLKAARAALGRTVDAGDRFLVNFNGRAQGLARISVQRALAGQAVPEVVKGRCVLIGFALPPVFPGLQIPLQGGKKKVSLLEYHAYALDTLLDRSWIREAGPWPKLACIALVAVIGVVLYQLLQFRAALWFTGLALGLYLVLAWGLLVYGRLWLPVLEIGLAQVALFAVVWRRRQAVQMDAVRELLLRLTREMRERLFPEDFADSEDSWSRIIVLITQTLRLERGIFLETLENDHRVREIASYRCSLTDIQERRRDFHRTPYTTALNQAGPVRVEGYLTAAGEDEIQYLVPLYFSGRVEGFWAFGVRSDQPRTIPNFEPLIKTYADEIAAQLQQRRERLRERKRRARFLSKILRLEAGELPLLEIDRAFFHLRRRLRLLEAIQDRMHAATVVYDLFGRVVQVNEPMSVLLERFGFRLFEMTAADMASGLTGQDLEQVRATLRQVVNHGESVSLPVSRTLGLDVDHVLHIHPVRQDEQTALPDGGRYPFQVMGILFEVTQLIGLSEMGDLREILFDWSSANCLGDLQWIRETASALARSGGGPRERETLLRGIEERTEHLLQMARRMGEVSSSEFLAGSPEFYPVEVLRAVKKAWRAVVPPAKGPPAPLNVDTPRQVNMVFAHRARLERLLRALMHLLVEDAGDPASVTARITQEGGDLFLSLASEGYGLPQPHVEELLEQGEPRSGEPAEWETLRRMRPVVAAWGGSLEARSGIGQGLSFVLRLKTLPPHS